MLHYFCIILILIGIGKFNFLYESCRITSPKFSGRDIFCNYAAGAYHCFISNIYSINDQRIHSDEHFLADIYPTIIEPSVARIVEMRYDMRSARDSRSFTNFNKIRSHFIKMHAGTYKAPSGNFYPAKF